MDGVEMKTRKGLESRRLSEHPQGYGGISQKLRILKVDRKKTVISYKIKNNTGGDMIPRKIMVTLEVRTLK